MSKDNMQVSHSPKLVISGNKFRSCCNYGDKNMNRVAGYGVEFPCQYIFQGDDFSLVSACVIM